MSFVPVGPTKTTQNQDPVLDCVNCPVKALIKEGSTYYCTHSFNVSKHTISKTSLGDVPTDVVENCKSCSVYQEKFQAKETAVERSRVFCPMNKVSQSVRDCSKCACLHAKKTEEHLVTLPGGSNIDKIYCGFPNVDFRALNIWFTPSKKKAIKEHVENVRSIVFKGKNENTKL